MTRRNSISKILDVFSELNMKLLSPEKYKNSNTKLDVECCVCGYKYSVTYGSVQQKHGCPNCRNIRLSKERRTSYKEIEIFLSEKNIFCNNLCEYENLYTVLICECLVCGHVWETNYSNLKCGGCPQCGVISRANKTRIPISQIIDYYNSKNIIVLYPEQYKNSRSVLDLYCNACGYQWQSTWGSSQKTKYVCPQCAYNMQACALEDFLLRVYSTHGDRISVINYGGQLSKKSLFHCNICDNNWNADGNAVIQGNGCPQCNLPKGEIRIGKCLEYNNVNFEREVKFEGCKNKHYLRFDFYLPDFDICIEYQGKQHYEPVTFGGSLDDSIEKFDTTQYNDQIKRDFCEQNGIYLLEIPYWDYDNIEEILNNVLGE